MGVAARRVHTVEEPGRRWPRRLYRTRDRTSLTRSCAHRCASHHRAVHRPVGGRRGPAPQGREPPTHEREHPHPRAGVAGDGIRAGRRRPATGRQFTQPGARPCAHPVAGACGSNPPIVCLARPPPDPAAQPRSGRLPTATPANHPDGQDRTRCSPRAPTAPSRRALSATRWCNQPTAVTVSAFLRLSQQLRRGVQHRRRGDATDAAVAVADGNADRGWGCRRRRCQS